MGESLKRVFYNSADPYTYDKHSQIIGYAHAISIFPPYRSSFEDLVVKNLDPWDSQSGKIAGILVFIRDLFVVVIVMFFRCPTLF